MSYVVTGTGSLEIVGYSCRSVFEPQGPAADRAA